MDWHVFQLEALHLTWGLLLVVVGMIWGASRSRTLRARLAETGLMKRLVPVRSTIGNMMCNLILASGIVLLIAAALDVRWGKQEQAVVRRGLDMFVIIDTSRSMLAEDVKPNRLERAKQYAIDLIGHLEGDRVGVITAAGRPSIRCPLTVDHGAARLVTGVLVTESGARGGSYIGDAVRLAMESFTDDESKHKLIVILSDGEDLGSYPLDAVRKARKSLAIPVITVGIGDADQGARIPIEIDGRRQWLTHDGKEVASKMNGSLLREIAQETEGVYVPVGTGNVDMGRVYDERIAAMERDDLETSTISQHTARYQWFLLPAVILLLIEWFLSGTSVQNADGAEQ